MSDPVVNLPVEEDDDSDLPDVERHVHMLEDPAKILEFMLSGKAIFTVKNRDTGNRATYRVEMQADGSWRVAAFTGTDNTKKGSYTHLRSLDKNGVWTPRKRDDVRTELEEAAKSSRDVWLQRFTQSVKYTLARGGKLTPNQEKALGRNMRKHKILGFVEDKMKMVIFPWVWNRLTNHLGLPEVIEIWHEGCCGCCGRRLTVPASVELGYGPDCAEILG